MDEFVMWRLTREGLEMTWKPVVLRFPKEPRCPECGSKDYDPAHGCFTAHGKFRAAA